MKTVDGSLHFFPASILNYAGPYFFPLQTLYFAFPHGGAGRGTKREGRERRVESHKCNKNLRGPEPKKHKESKPNS